MAFMLEGGLMVFFICLGIGIIQHGLVLVKIEKNNYEVNEGRVTKK